MDSLLGIKVVMDYINSLYPTIKFTLVYSESSLNVLDLTLKFPSAKQANRLILETDRQPTLLRIHKCTPSTLNEGHTLWSCHKTSKKLLHGRRLSNKMQRIQRIFI